MTAQKSPLASAPAKTAKSDGADVTDRCTPTVGDMDADEAMDIGEEPLPGAWVFATNSGTAAAHRGE